MILCQNTPRFKNNRDKLAKPNPPLPHYICHTSKLIRRVPANKKLIVSLTSKQKY